MDQTLGGALKKLCVIAVACLWAGATGFAQCAMCKQALLHSEEGQRLIAGMNAGILFLLAMPFAIVGLVALRIYQARQPGRLAAWLELTKPRIVAMVLVTTGVGYYLGGPGRLDWPGLFAVLAGIALTAGGSAVLNNYLERDEDAKMERTRQRALPRGVIAPPRALAFGVVLVLAGVTWLAGSVNLLTSFLALLAAFLYVLVYTPLKRVTWLNTTIGAIPGAIPPLCGWAAASGQLAPGAWALFFIMAAWQHPHFHALAWLWREDYRRAGFRMLPVVDATGRRTGRQVVLFSALLLGVSLWPVALGLAGKVYLAGATMLGVLMLAGAVRLWWSASAQCARRVFFASLIYLPLLCALLVLRW